MQTRPAVLAHMLAITLVAVAGATVIGAAPASAEVVKCQRAVAKAAAKYEQDRTKALARCEGLKITGKLASGTVCASEAKTAATIAKAAAKLTKDIATGCGGKDKRCGVDPDGTEDFPAEIGFPASCHDFGASGCDAPVAHCGDVASCLGCVAESTSDLALGQATDDLVPGTASNKTLNKCQQAIAKETSLLVQQRAKILQKCWDLRLRGKHAGACPDGGAAPKTGPRIAFDDLAKAEAKAATGICRLCGGSDKLCGGGDDQTVSAIGFAATCADVTVPGSGAECDAGGTIDSLGELSQCVVCTASHATDCADRGAVPQYAAYPAVCNPAPPQTCTTAEVTIATSFVAQPSPNFVAGISTLLDYPGPRLEIPGSNSASSVGARVTNLTGVGGSLVSAADLNIVPDAFDDRVSVGMVNTGSALPPGNFVKILFDCRAGEPAPTVGSFTCTSSVSTLEGEITASSCSVAGLVVTP